jgi:hypothetical protein
MRDRIRIKPARAGLVVRAPGGRVLPAEGLDVTPTSFWLRRLRAGDVIQVEQTQARRSSSSAPRARKGSEPEE